MARPDGATHLRLGTRGGDLALWQAREAARRIAERRPSLTVDICVIRTAGDRAPDAPITRIGGSGLFTREIETALLDGDVDLAVHSLKDLPTRMPEGLVLGALLPRADARDVLVAASGLRLRDLPPGARIGTSSPRRRAQLLACRPDISALDVRGNVPTRLAKLDAGLYDGLLLARAGLMRLSLDHRIAEVIDPAVMVPAAGQGAIAVQARADDREVIGLLTSLDHEPTRWETDAERACLARLGAGCQAPVGVMASLDGQTLSIVAAVADAPGRRVVRMSERASVVRAEDAAAAGLRLAERLIELGAAALLAADGDGAAGPSSEPGTGL